MVLEWGEALCLCHWYLTKACMCLLQQENFPRRTLLRRRSRGRAASTLIKNRLSPSLELLDAANDASALWASPRQHSRWTFRVYHITKVNRVLKYIDLLSCVFADKSHVAAVRITVFLYSVVYLSLYHSLCSKLAPLYSIQTSHGWQILVQNILSSRRCSKISR